MNDRNSPTILETNIFYFVIALVFLTIGAYVQHADINSGLLITEFEIILIPTIFYLGIRRYNLNEVLRLNKISFSQAILTPLIVIFAYPVGIFLNLIVIMILGYFGKIITPPLPTPSNINEFIIGFFIISLSAGICEEIMFRGMIMKSYERLGKTKAILISGVMFGIFHFNIQNLIGPIFLGILFGYIVYKTNSIFTAIIAHATNNAIAWGLSYFVSKIPFLPKETNTDMFTDITSKEKLMSIVVTLAIFGLWALISGGIAFLFLWLLPKSKDETTIEDTEKEEIDIIEVVDSYENKSNIIKIIFTYIPLVLVFLIFIYFTIRILSSI